ncbi:hypothetical protein, partial [Achromobacter aegrifaciens]|uniref:hypothetical protein n=1 Tax=Achromobacter aegrifaciens TaxID=1287736 RepID=UPI0028ADF7F9
MKRSWQSKLAAVAGRAYARDAVRGRFLDAGKPGPARRDGARRAFSNSTRRAARRCTQDGLVARKLFQACSTA